METTQDEQNQIGSTSSSGGGGGGGGGNGGRSSKKAKQKKIPQRGLGVAQLERIRLEEQNKKDSSIGNLSSSPSSPITTFPSSDSLTNFHNHNQSSTSSLVPFSPRPLMDLPCDDSVFKSSPSIDKFPSNTTTPLTNQINGGASYEIGWSPLPGHGNAPPKLWSSEQAQVGENPRFQDHQLAFRPNFSSESNHIFSRPNVVQRNQQYPQPCPSMVNVSTATSSSSLLSFQMEPPSNQSYYGNYSHLRHEEEKMVGMKFPYPFSLEIPPCPSFQYRFPPFDGPINRLAESTPCDNGSTRSFYPTSTIFREAPTCSTFVSKSYPRDIIENGVLNGDFLTLAPPTTASSACPSATFKHKSAYSNSCNQNLFEFELLPCKGSMQDSARHQQPSGSYQPMYSFLPPAKTQNIQARTPWNNVNASARDNIDLNLKL